MTNEVNIPWVNKYRPRKIEDVVMNESDKKLLLSLVEDVSKLPPSLLFFGPPGTGKTTVSSIIHNKATQLGIQVVEVFGSINNGVEYVRNNIMSICAVKGKKIIRIEEFDRFTKEAQMALRNIMGEDKYIHVTFVLSANEIWRIHDAIQSRSICIKFDSPGREECKNKLDSIIKSEKIEYSNEEEKDKVLYKIVDMFYPRIRDMISLLQVSCSSGELFFDLTKIASKDDTIKAIVLFDKLLLTGFLDLKEIVKISSNIKLQSFYEVVHDKALSSGFIEISILCREMLDKLNQSLSPELELIIFFKKCKEIITNFIVQV